jgi:hypothetical protein
MRLVERKKMRECKDLYTRIKEHTQKLGIAHEQLSADYFKINEHLRIFLPKENYPTITLGDYALLIRRETLSRLLRLYEAKLNGH